APPPPETMRIERETAARESSAVVLGRTSGALHAFVADEDDAAIVEVDLAAGAIVHTTSVGSRPRDLLLLPDGRLAVTLPEQAAIAIYTRDVASELHEVARWKTRQEPIAMALDPKDATLVVTTGASHALTAFDLASA